MQKISDTEVQANLLHEKKRKLEENLKLLDARDTLLIETAARRELEEYRKHARLKRAWGPIVNKRVS
jgi:hypothetical protein